MKKIRSKNLLKLLLAVAFAVTLIAGIFALKGTAAHAETESPALPETHAHTAACPADGNLTDGSYYLANDLTGKFTVTGEVTLCLNGNTITGSGNGSVITVSEGATFTLCDCVGTGVITGGTGNERAYCESGGGVYVDGTFIMTGGTISGNTAGYDGGGGGVFVSENGAFKMSGGTISGNTARYGGGVSFCDQDVYSDAIGTSINGTFEMTGGTISGNTAEYYGGGVAFYGNGTFEMSGGVISGNTAGYGGGVFNFSSDEMDSKGTFIMTGGTISGNTASLGGGVCIPVPWVEGGESLSLTASSYAAGGSDGDYVAFIMAGGTISENTATQDGGGVFVGGVEDGCFEMTGGTITGNTAQGYGGGVCVGGAFKVSGAPNITGNKVNGVDDNVSMDLYTTMTVTDEFTEGAKMGVTLADGFSGAFTDGYGENNKDGNNIVAPDEYLVSDADGYFPALDGGEVILVTGKAAVTTGGTTTEYATLQAAWEAANDATDAATVKMYADAEITSMLTVSSDKNITLDINGYMLKYTGDGDASVITVNGTFTLCDNAGTGCITGGTGTSVNSYLHGGGVFVGSGGTFEMSGGEISGNTAEYYGGGVYVSDNAQFTMSGGEISDNNSGANGGGVNVAQNGAFTMSGGTISGNTTGTSGGGVFVASDATFKMTGGTISDNTADISGGGVQAIGSFTMEDGKICKNAVRNSAGGVGISGTFVLSGGEISGNTAEFYGGGALITGTFKLSGTPVITGNKSGTLEGGTDNNVYIFDTITVTGALTEGAKIGVNNTGAVATGFTQSDKPSKYFIPDDPANDCIYASDGTVNIGTHVWNDGTVITQPTCTDEGEKTFTCTGCGATKTQTVPALGHDYAEKFTVDKEATALEAGLKSRHCSRCDSVTEVTAIPAILSVGALVGIVIGGFILLLLIAYVVCYFALYRRGVLLKGKLFDAIYVPMNAIFGKKKQDSEAENSK